jgi:hypothetical protein
MPHFDPSEAMAGAKQTAANAGVDVSAPGGLKLIDSDDAGAYIAATTTETFPDSSVAHHTTVTAMTLADSLMVYCSLTAPADDANAAGDMLDILKPFMAHFIALNEGAGAP